MEQNRIGVRLQEEAFGILLPYIKDHEITDIDYNGSDVWVTDIYNDCRKLDLVLDAAFIEKFCNDVKNAVSEEFNQGSPVLEAETEQLRISIGHESIARTGRSICIRKSIPSVRISAPEAVSSGYCTPELLHFLLNCVAADMRMVVCGLTGAGKTELVKFLAQYIPKQERVITIEDNLELHYRDINPGANGVELKVNGQFQYADAIRFSLRQHPKRIMLSEARGEEAKELIVAWSTGTSGYSTIHTDSVLNIPDRLLNMMPHGEDEKRYLNDIYRYVDIGLLVRIREENGQRRRLLDEVCVFDRADGKNRKYLLADEDGIRTRTLPDNLMRKFKRGGVADPWYSQLAEEELAKEIRGCKV